MQIRHPAAEQVAGKLSRYLDRLFDEAADRLAPRVADRIAGQFEAQFATLEVLSDKEALDDLRTSSDGDLRDYDEIRREVGLA